MRNQLKLILTMLLAYTLFIGCDKEEQVGEEIYENCKPEVVEPQAYKIDDQTGLIEFDIIPSTKRDTKSFNKGAVVTDAGLLWDKGIVPYTIRGNVQTDQGTILGIEDEEEKERIREALAEMSEQTGILFPEYESIEALRKEHTDGIVMGRGAFASSSYLGRDGGLQGLYLAFDVNKGTIKHEFMHALGVNHEFTRHDRDEYVTVNFENIPEGYHRQFDIRDTNKDCGTFDIGSIMMYGSFQIRGDRDNPEMTLKDGTTFERSTDLSQIDINTVKSLYADEFKERESNE